MICQVSATDRDGPGLTRSTSLPTLKKYPVPPSQAKPVPSLKKMKAKLKPLATCEPHSCSLTSLHKVGSSPKPKKASLVPFSAYTAFTLSLPSQKQIDPSFKKKHSLLDPCSTLPSTFSNAKKSGFGLASKKVTLESLSNCPSLPSSWSGPIKSDPSFSLDWNSKKGSSKKVILEPLSKCSGFSPCLPGQEKTVPALQKTKEELGPISTSAASSSHGLQKVPSVPSLGSIAVPTGSHPEFLPVRPGTVPNVTTQKQKTLGPQSLRGGAVKSDPFDMLNCNTHAKACFQDLLMTEEKMCAEWAIFYHSYSTSALIYEVQAAIAAVLFGFRSQTGALPRLLVDDFSKVPNALALQRIVSEETASKSIKKPEECHDGLDQYMAVGLSTMLSLTAYGPEACPTRDFSKGYANSELGASWDPDLSSALNRLLKTCCVPNLKIDQVIKDIVTLSEKHGLDVSSFNGRQCRSKQPGHLLQICIRRDIVDKLAYASLPYGHADETRQPMSRFMDSNSSFDYGQARVLARPEYFMEPDAVRLHTFSADPEFHANREIFQKELTQLLSVILGDASSREDAAKGIYGGVLPDGWTSDEHQKSRFCKPNLGARHNIKLRAKRSPGEL